MLIQIPKIYCYSTILVLLQFLELNWQLNGASGIFIQIIDLIRLQLIANDLYCIL